MSSSQNTVDEANQYSATVARLESKNLKSEMNNDDQRFLLYFIFGTFFGPDIKDESTQKSVLQRVAEGLSSYTSDQLTGSVIKVMEIERIYFHILRNADKSLTVKLPFLRRYIQGIDCAPSCNYPKFPDLFPLELHPQTRFKSRHKVVHNVVFINNPETFYLKPEDIERFKRLSGVEDLHVDIDACNGNMSLPCTSVVPPKACESDDFTEIQDQLPQPCLVAPIRSVPCDEGVVHEDESDSEKVGHAVLFLPSRPTKKEWNDIVAATKNGFALTGSAAVGRVGPTIGAVDIGECEDSYLFRMSLPGVIRDEKEFSCEVDNGGKVYIGGVSTTGEKVVSRYSMVFEMQTQNLCQPGKFSATFQLPGPVDPHQFSGQFGMDGILEGVVRKRKHGDGKVVSD